MNTSADLGVAGLGRLLVSAALFAAWRETIVIVPPETILKWHRSAYRVFWRHRSKSRNRPRLSADTINLIRKGTSRARSSPSGKPSLAVWPHGYHVARYAIICNQRLRMTSGPGTVGKYRV